jgi:hypothetical protein
MILLIRCPLAIRCFSDDSPLGFAIRVSPRQDQYRQLGRSYSVSYSPRKLARHEPAEPTFDLVGVAGFEPAASSSRTKRAAKLRHTPPAAQRPNPRKSNRSVGPA